MEEGNKKLVKQVVLFIVVFTIGFFGTKYVMSSFKSGDPELEAAAVKLNKECPKIIDSETRLDSTRTFDNTFQYHFSLISFSKGDSTLDIEEIKEMLRNSAQKNFDNNPGMKGFRGKDTSLKYIYKDKAGKDLFDFTIKTSKK